MSAPPTGPISGNLNAPKDINESVTTDCNLYWRRTGIAANASNTTTLTVIGESNSALTPDQVIVVHVHLADMKESLIYDSQWTGALDGATVPGEQPYPHVTFNPKLLADSAVADNDGLSAEGRFLLVDPVTEVAAPLFTDDGADASLWTLQSYFMNSAFTFTNSDIGQIPAESVKKVEAGKLVVDVLGAGGFPAAELLEKGEDVLSASYNYTGADDTDFALDLFKQAAAAGKVKAATPSATGGAPTSTADASSVANFSQVDFQVNDSITIYVTYNMIKKKKVKLDAAAGGGAAGFKITVNGAEVEFADDQEETSTNTAVMVAYQFVAIPDA